MIQNQRQSHCNDGNGGRFREREREREISKRNAISYSECEACAHAGLSCTVISSAMRILLYSWQSCRHSLAAVRFLCTFRRHRRFVLMFLGIGFCAEILFLRLVFRFSSHFIAFVGGTGRGQRADGQSECAVQTNRINLNVSYSFIPLLGRVDFVFIYFALTLVSHDTLWRSPVYINHKHEL